MTPKRNWKATNAGLAPGDQNRVVRATAAYRQTSPRPTPPRPNQFLLENSQGRLNVGFTCKRGWRGPGPARAVTDAIVRWKRLLNRPPPKSKLCHMPNEECDHTLLGQPPSCHTHGQILDFAVARRQLMSIDQQEHFSSRDGGTVVTVDEWMIRTEMKMIGRCFLGDTCVKVDTIKCRLRHRDRRFQEATVTQARVAAEFLDDSSVNLKHSSHRQISNLAHHLANRRNTAFLFFTT